MPRIPRRPARKQVSAPVPSEQTSDFLSPEEHWKRRKAPITRATHRCNVEADAGATLATTHATTPLRCVFFARGVCHRGPQCDYVHEIPDNAFFRYAGTQPQFDCFGRQRSGEDLTNRNDCTTLFIYLGGVLIASKENNADAIAALIEDDFSAFGPIVLVNVIINKSIAFVRYSHRSSAEFAKEAMHRQCLRGDRTETVLSVRWANEDPNPKAQARVKREREERFVSKVDLIVGDVPGVGGPDDEDSDDWRRYISDDEGEDAEGLGGPEGCGAADDREDGGGGDGDRQGEKGEKGDLFDYPSSSE
jgi:hypothetical protein